MGNKCVYERFQKNFCDKLHVYERFSINYWLYLKKIVNILSSGKFFLKKKRTDISENHLILSTILCIWAIPRKRTIFCKKSHFVKLFLINQLLSNTILHMGDYKSKNLIFQMEISKRACKNLLQAKKHEKFTICYEYLRKKFKYYKFLASFVVRVAL